MEALESLLRGDATAAITELGIGGRQGEHMVAVHGGEEPYAVRFSGRELRGEDADAGLSVVIDAWEVHLEPVGTTGGL